MRYVIAFLLIMPGLAHLSGFLASWTRRGMGFSDRPWLLALLGLTGAGLGPAFAQAWWPALALAGAAFSLAASLPWWNTVVPGAKAGALFDLVILAALLSPWQGRLVEALH
jgi:hypothetical protein